MGNGLKFPESLHFRYELQEFRDTKMVTHQPSLRILSPMNRFTHIILPCRP